MMHVVSIDPDKTDSSLFLSWVALLDFLGLEMFEVLCGAVPSSTSGGDNPLSMVGAAGGVSP